MSNALTITGARPSFLPALPERGTPSEFSAGLSSGGLSIPVLSFRGKEFRLRLEDNEVNTRKRELQVVLVSARPNVSRRFYDTAYTGAAADEAKPPRCMSSDGAHPDGVSPVSPSCTGCPNNEWGSATTATRTSKGKACSEYKRLVVYPVGLASADRTPAPCVLDVPATSLKGLKGYVDTLLRNGIPPETYAVELRFSDAEFPQLEFWPVRYVDEAEYAHVTGLKRDADVLDALGVQIAPSSQQALPAAPAPTPAPAPEEAPKAAKKKKTRVVEVEEDDDEPVPFQSPPAATDDLEAQLNALLNAGKK